MQNLCAKKHSTVLLLVLCFSYLLVPGARSQVNLSGKPGLLYVPTADSTEEGLLRFGLNSNPKEYARGAVNRNDELIMFVNLTILPRLDININVLKPISTPDHPVIKDLGDRQLDIRYLLLKEKRYRPAVALVLSSPFTVDASLLTHVVVATKTFPLAGGWSSMLTAGLGSPYFVYRDASVTANSQIFKSFKWQKKSEYKNNNRYLVGPFGGIKLDYRQAAGIMLEYDSRNVNVGGYLRLFKQWNVQAGLINFDRFTLGTAYSFLLLKPSRRLKKIYEDNP